MVIFSKVRLGVSPDVNALATIMVLIVALGIVGPRILDARQEKKREARDADAASAGSRDLNRMAHVLLGLDVGGSSIKGGLVDVETGTLDGRARQSLPTPQPSTPVDVMAPAPTLAAKLPSQRPGRLRLSRAS